MRPLSFFCLLLAVGPLGATETTWASPATGQALRLELLEPTNPRAARKQPVVFYLVNLAAPRVGTESDEAILRDLRAEGNLVVVVDYAHHPRARWPHLNRDLATLRRQLHQRGMLGDRRPDFAHIFIVPSGHRLKRNVVFDRDPFRPLAMDIIYPSRPAQPVGTVLEFSCDNQDRMGNYSLQFCTDTILEGAATEGWAVAMADHPADPPYKGLDPMPDSAWKIKAAVRTLRAVGEPLGLNGRIVPVGFSRGSGMALMLVTTDGHSEFDGHGEHQKISSAVQGAVVMSGRFTYLDLKANDPMIPKYVKWWGRRQNHLEDWRRQGALDYLAGPAPVPLFLTINVTESPEALHQMEVLRRRLTELGSPFAYHPEVEPRGHRVPLDEAVLRAMSAYLAERLGEAAPRSPAS